VGDHRGCSRNDRRIGLFIRRAGQISRNIRGIRVAAGFLQNWTLSGLAHRPAGPQGSVENRRGRAQRDCPPNCGTSTSSAAPKGIAIRAFASCTAVGRRDCRSRCGKPTSAATSCLSITPATRCRRGHEPIGFAVDLGDGCIAVHPLRHLDEVVDE